MRRNLDIDNFISPAGNLPARPEAMKPVTAVKKNVVRDRTQALHQFTSRGWVKLPGCYFFCLWSTIEMGRSQGAAYLQMG